MYFKEARGCFDTSRASWNLGCAIRQEGRKTLQCRVDASYSGDECERSSITETGCVINTLGAAVNKISQIKKKMTVSSNQAGYVAIRRKTQDVGFQRHLLLTMGVEQHQPTVMFAYNLGAVSRVQNNTLGNRSSRHLDNKCHYTREQLKVKTTVVGHIARKE